jgi:hypothetical protein
MERVREWLAPAIEQLPPDIRPFFEGDGLWVVLGVAALLAFGLLMLLIRYAEKLFGRPREKVPDSDEGLRIDLAGCPPAPGEPADPCLAFYHYPVRLRLVVVAGVGKDETVSVQSAAGLLDRVVPGLGKVVEHDRPFVRAWPGQISRPGFANTVHRCTVTGDREGEPSHWIVVAGRIQVGKVPLLVGLAMWTDEPLVIERLTLEPHQWRDVLRLRERAPERTYAPRPS